MRSARLLWIAIFASAALLAACGTEATTEPTARSASAYIKERKTLQINLDRAMRRIDPDRRTGTSYGWQRYVRGVGRAYAANLEGLRKLQPPRGLADAHRLTIRCTELTIADTRRSADTRAAPQSFSAWSLTTTDTCDEASMALSRDAAGAMPNGQFVVSKAQYMAIVTRELSDPKGIGGVARGLRRTREPRQLVGVLFRAADVIDARTTELTWLVPPKDVVAPHVALVHCMRRYAFDLREGAEGIRKKRWPRGFDVDEGLRPDTLRTCAQATATLEAAELDTK